ncbi:MAG: hypothetical protein VKM34_08890 [Cyanobacteriota bacterium]|nr:hypothetical protein [Cyanobacteriota bacterium]
MARVGFEARVLFPWPVAHGMFRHGDVISLQLVEINRDRIAARQGSTERLNIMDGVIPLFFIIIVKLLILLPPLAVWFSVFRRASARSAWFPIPLALIGPFITAFVLCVLLWLPAYSGRCGGWLGETGPCGFRQYALETMFWAAMSMAIPASTGVLLGVVVLIVGLIRRHKSR